MIDRHWLTIFVAVIIVIIKVILMRLWFLVINFKQWAIIINVPYQIGGLAVSLGSHFIHVLANLDEMKVDFLYYAQLFFFLFIIILTDYLNKNPFLLYN